MSARRTGAWLALAAAVLSVCLVFLMEGRQTPIEPAQQEEPVQTVMITSSHNTMPSGMVEYT